MPAHVTAYPEPCQNPTAALNIASEMDCVGMDFTTKHMQHLVSEADLASVAHARLNRTFTQWQVEDNDVPRKALLTCRFVWGRGAIDTKFSLTAMLEAATNLLASE